MEFFVMLPPWKRRAIPFSQLKLHSWTLYEYAKLSHSDDRLFHHFCLPIILLSSCLTLEATRLLPCSEENELMENRQPVGSLKGGFGESIRSVNIVLWGNARNQKKPCGLSFENGITAELERKTLRANSTRTNGISTMLRRPKGSPERGI